LNRFRRILRDAGLSPDTVRLAAGALWLLEMAALLLHVHDESPGGARSHRRLDDALDLVVPMLPVLDTPFGRDLAARGRRAGPRGDLAASAPSLNRPRARRDRSAAGAAAARCDPAPP
jgi:hypothetical protein